MGADERDLVTTEGVDEGSKDSATEAAGDATATDTLGLPSVAAPDNGEQDAAPEPIGGEAPGPGQRNEVGEG
jgi:hypothetical protein